MKTTKIFLLAISIIFYSFLNSINSQWVEDSSIIKSFTVISVATNNEYNFVGTQGDGIFRAPINTTNWVKISNEELNAKNITSIVVNNNIIIAGTKNYGIWRKTISDSIWTNTLKKISVNALLIKNDTVYAGLASKGGIIISTNNGLSFSSISIIGTHGVRSLTANNNYIYAAVEDPGIMKYDGVKWEMINYNFGKPAISTLAINGSFIYAGTEKNGIFSSSDKGDTWQKSNFDTNSQIFSFAFHYCFVFAGTYQKGVCVLDQNTNSIPGSEFYDNPHGTTVRSFLIIDNYIYACTVGKVWKRKLSIGPYYN